MSEPSKYTINTQSSQIIEHNAGTVIGIQHNYAPEPSTEATQQIAQLLTKLRTQHPNKPDAEIFEILLNGFATMPNNNPQNWRRWQDIFSILFVSGVEGVKIICPPAGIPIEVGKRLYEIYDRNRKQLPGT